MESTRRQLLDARAATREMAEAMATQERLTQEREDRAARLRAEFEEKTAERERAERAAPLRVDAAAFAGQLNDMLARLARLENDAGEGSKKALSSTATEAGVGLDPSPSPSSFFPSRLAELEAQVLPTRVSELEDRVSELASAMVDLASAPPPTNPSSASHPRPPRPRFDPRARRSRPRFGIYARGSRGWRAPTSRARWTGPAPWKPPPPPRSRRSTFSAKKSPTSRRA